MKTTGELSFNRKIQSRLSYPVIAFLMLLQTFSAQAQWQLVAGNGLKPSAINKIDFYDALHGAAYGTGDTAYFTSDGGENWIKRKVFIFSNSLNRTLFMVGPHVYYSTEYHSIGAVSDYQHCSLRRVDGALLATRTLIEGGTGPGVCFDKNRWVQSANLYHQGSFSQYETYTSSLNGEGMNTSTTCYVDVGEPDTCSLSRMAVTPKGVVYMFKGGKVMKTTDFSLHELTVLPGSPNFLQKMEATGDSVLYGRVGAVLQKSTDEGTSWNELTPGFSISDFTFVQRDTGFASRSTGGIKVTHDGGQTWQDQSLPLPNLTIWQFSRPVGRALYALCSNKRILRNTDYTRLPQQPMVFESNYRLDSTFASNGIGRRNWGNDAGVTAQRILRNTDGSYLICGYEYMITQNAYYNNIWKINACGQTDSSFGVNGLLRHTFEQRNTGYDYALQPDGKIIAVGTQAPSNAGSQQKAYIARYHANGKPDSSFFGVGSRKFEEDPAAGFYSVFPFPGGRFLATGGQNFVRVKSNGDLDSTFGINGKLQRPTPPGVNFSYEGSGLMRKDGTIWTAAASWPGGDVRLGVYAVDTTGKIDSTFGTNGFFITYNFSLGSSAKPLSSVLQSSGKAVIGWTENDLGVRLTRIMKPGKVDSTFGTNGTVFVPGSRMTSILLLSGDRILVSQNNTPSPGSVFTLLDSSGAPVPGFSINNGANNLVMVGGGTEFLSSLLEEPNGEWTLAGGTREFHVCRVLPAPRSAMPNIKQNGNTLDAQVNLPSATFQWYWNGNLISGATSETLNMIAAGTYKVVVASAKGCLGEDSVLIPVLGIEDQIGNGAWWLYPNPSETSFRVEGNEKLLRVSRVDMQGRITDCPIQENQTVEVSGWKSGLYQIRLETANGAVVKGFWKR